MKLLGRAEWQEDLLQVKRLHAMHTLQRFHCQNLTGSFFICSFSFLQQKA